MIQTCTRHQAAPPWQKRHLKGRFSVPHSAPFDKLRAGFHIPHLFLPLLLGFLALASAPVAPAHETRVWEQDRYEDFEKGTLQNLSLRSDGKLLLAPKFRLLGDPALSYIWALAEDSRGRIYVAGGSPGKVVRITRDPKDPKAAPKIETVFQSKELEIHALAVDRQDNVYAAASPDPKVYKITPEGQSRVFYEPDAKYVWALAWDGASKTPGSGYLYVATGDKGKIFRVDGSGKGVVFFESDDTHVRSLAVGPDGSVIAGTDPSGLILRLRPSDQGSGEAFVLYEAGKKEVTALMVGEGGSIYAAAVGDKPPRAAPAPAAPPLPVPVAPVVTVTPGAAPTTTWPGVGAPPPNVAGGTEVYRILPDGSPRRLWSSRDDFVYALTFNSAARPLLGSGNKGKVFQLDSDDLSTTLVKAPATQVTALIHSRQGSVLVGTANIGKVFEIGSDYESEGTFESEVFDARNFARWGRVHWKNSSGKGAAITLYTRSGNVDNPDRNWSPWSNPYRNAAGERAASPGARFLQWKAVLATDDGHRTPMLDEVDIAYLPKNIAPVVDEVQVTPPGYRFNPVVQPQPQPQQAIALPPLGQARSSTPPPPMHFDAPPQVFPQKGAQGVRWAAHDDNDDQLIFSVYIRGVNESSWKLLKERITDKFYSWDAATFPDGVYVVKVVASDSPSNSEEEALTGEKEGQPFEIDNTPPRILNLRAAREGRRVRVAFQASDAMSVIRRAEFSVDGGDWQIVPPVDKISDSLEEDYNFQTAELPPGEHTVAVRVYDKVDNAQVEKVVVR